MTTLRPLPTPVASGPGGSPRRAPHRPVLTWLFAALLGLAARALPAACVAIQCPADLTVGCQGPNGAIVAFTPVATSNCDAPFAVSCTPPPGSTFPVGTNIVSCRVLDTRGNEARCSFRVIVTNGAPQIHCGTPVTITTGPNCQGVLPVLSITAADDCTPTNQLVISQNPPAGTLLPVGTHFVTITVSDSHGRKAQCQTQVIVRDTTPPRITCPGPIRVFCAPGGTNVSFNVPATDECGPASVICLPPSGSFFPPGTNLVTCIARDLSNNTATCSFPVIVLADAMPLTILAGAKDDYALPGENTQPGACLVAAMAPLPIGSIFDVNVGGRWLAHTFSGLPSGIQGATLHIAMRPRSVWSSNDVLRIGLTNCPAPGAPAGWVWAQPVWSLPGAKGTWTTNDSTVFHLDLNAMPGGPGAPPQVALLLLAAMGLETNHRLDVAVGRNTIVDYMELELRVCGPQGTVSGVPYTLRRGEVLHGPAGARKFRGTDRTGFEVDLDLGRAEGIEIGTYPGTIEIPGTNNLPLGCTLVKSLVPTITDWQPAGQPLTQIRFLDDANPALTAIELQQTNTLPGHAIEVWKQGVLVSRYFFNSQQTGVRLPDDACIDFMGFLPGEFFVSLKQSAPVWFNGGAHVSGQQAQPVDGDRIRMFFSITASAPGQPDVSFDPDIIVKVRGNELDFGRVRVRKSGQWFLGDGDGVVTIGDAVTGRPFRADGELFRTCFEAGLVKGDTDSTVLIPLPMKDLLAHPGVRAGTEFTIAAAAHYPIVNQPVADIGRLHCRILSLDPLRTELWADFSGVLAPSQVALFGTGSPYLKSGTGIVVEGAPDSLTLAVVNNHAMFGMFFDAPGGATVQAGDDLIVGVDHGWFEADGAPPGVHQGPYQFCVSARNTWEPIPLTLNGPTPPPAPAPPLSACVTIDCPPAIHRASRDGQPIAVEYTVAAASLCGSNVVLTSQPPSGSSFPVGVTIVTCHAVDNLGYSARCQFPVVVYPVEPRLSVRPLGRRAIELRWSAELDHWILEGSDTLAPRSWRNLGNAAELDGGEFRRVLPAEGAPRYFRLRTP